jgi:hypothetical protein
MRKKKEWSSIRPHQKKMIAKRRNRIRIIIPMEMMRKEMLSRIRKSAEWADESQIRIHLTRVVLRPMLWWNGQQEEEDRGSSSSDQKYMRREEVAVKEQISSTAAPQLQIRRK